MLLLGIMFFFVLFGLVVTPIIWNYFLIPDIEARVKQKLVRNIWYDIFLFDSFFCPQFEVFPVIIRKYLCKNSSFKTRSWLDQVDYKIQEASSFEIFMAFFTLIVVLIPLIILIILSVLMFLGN